MNFRIKKSTYLSIYFVIFSLIILKLLYVQLITGYDKESWGITEWLVNYQGGFVRRGLIGEILYRLYYAIGLSPYYTIVISCLLFYLILIIFFVKSFIKKGYSLFILPFVFFLGNPIINDFWIRKDILVVLIFISIVYLVVKKARFYLLSVNLLLIIGLLIHESIAFFTYPILFLLILYNFREQYHAKYSSLKLHVLSAVSLLTSVLVFFAVALFKGSWNTADAIWNSWIPVQFPYDRPIITNIVYDFPGAIDGISWSTSKGLSKITEFLGMFSYDMYAPLMLFLTICIVYYILSNINKLNDKIVGIMPSTNNRLELSSLLLLQFFSVLPLFIIGNDYGRWIFLWVTTSFALNMLIPDQKIKKIVPQFIVNWVDVLNKTITSTIGNSKGVIILLALNVGFYYVNWDFIFFLKSNSVYLVITHFSFFIIKVLGL